MEHQAIIDRPTAPAAPRARYRAALAYVEAGLSDHLAAADASRRGSATPGAPAPPSLVMFGGDDDVADAGPRKGNGTKPGKKKKEKTLILMIFQEKQEPIKNAAKIFA